MLKPVYIHIYFSMFCRRPRSIFFLGSLSENVRVLLFSLCLSRSCEESAPYKPKRFRPFHWSPWEVMFDCCEFLWSFIFVWSVFRFFFVGISYSQQQTFNTTLEDDQENGRKRLARMEPFLHNLDPHTRKIKLERLHLKILKRKYTAVFNRTCLNND